MPGQVFFARNRERMDEPFIKANSVVVESERRGVRRAERNAAVAEENRSRVHRLRHAHRYIIVRSAVNPRYLVVYFAFCGEKA